jgi:hypothetical protein
MSSYRTGDRISLTGLVQKVEGGFVMVEMDGALDPSVPAMVSVSHVALLRASIHEGDEVAGGYRVHSSIPGTPLVLLQLIDGDPNDPGTFSTAVRDGLDLVRTGSDEQPAAPAASPKPQPASPTGTVQAPLVAATQKSAEVRAPSAAHVAEAASPRSGEQAGAGHVDATGEGDGSDAAGSAPAQGTAQAGPLLDADVADRVTGLADDAQRAQEGRSIADMGVVREEANPLKEGGQELLLDEPVEDEGRS